MALILAATLKLAICQTTVIDDTAIAVASLSAAFASAASAYSSANSAFHGASDSRAFNNAFDDVISASNALASLSSVSTAISISASAASAASASASAAVASYIAAASKAVSTSPTRSIASQTSSLSYQTPSQISQPATLQPSSTPSLAMVGAAVGGFIGIVLVITLIYVGNRRRWFARRSKKNEQGRGGSAVELSAGDGHDHSDLGQGWQGEKSGGEMEQVELEGSGKAVWSGYSHEVSELPGSVPDLEMSASGHGYGPGDGKRKPEKFGHGES